MAEGRVVQGGAGLWAPFALCARVPLHPTQRLQGGRYVLLGLLRTGGEAEVWRALDTTVAQERALKVFPAAEGGADAAARELALARRISHPNVVRVDDAFVDGDHAFVVMELAEGSLAERVATLGPLSPAEALAALSGPLSALEAAHAAGIVHRDIKPHNLLVFGALDGPLLDSENGRPRATVKLSDFGIAQVRAEGLTRTRSGAFLGSLPFMSPEQRRDPRKVGPPTDVYAAAVTLAWLVTGRAPGDLYLPETWEELRRALQDRGLPRQDIERIVGAVEAGGKWSATERPDIETFAKVQTSSTRHPTPSKQQGKYGYLLMVIAIAATLTGLYHMRGSFSRQGAPSEIVRCADAVSQWVDAVRMGPLETTSATIADVDGDRAPDSLFTNQMEETVTIWWGRVGEMPTERTEVPIGRSHASVAVGDVDGNGTLDLVAALQDDAAFGIAHGMGGRQFGAPERLFQSPPPSFVALADVTGDTGLDILYGELFHNVMVRERAGGSWLPHQKLLGLEATTQVVGLTSASKQFFLLLTGRQGFTVRSLDGRRESIINALTRWVPGSQGSEATYALHGSGNLVRRSADDTLCAVGPYTAPWTPAAAGDLDGDGFIDVVALDSCRQCTSNHIFMRGIAEEQAPGR
jgi:hypothetical protein